jgi:hypothetical protein
LAKDFLCLLPVIDSLLQGLILLPGQGDGNGLGLDLACPLVAGAAGSGSSVLDIPVADPAQAPQAGPEPGIFVFNLGEVDVHEYEA